MTPKERKSPDVLKASRKKRIAAGSGTKVEDINRMLKMHRKMADVMKAMSGRRQARPDGRPRQHAGPRRRWRHAEPGADGRNCRSGCRAARPICLRRTRRQPSSTMPGTAAEISRRPAASRPRRRQASRPRRISRIGKEEMTISRRKRRLCPGRSAARVGILQGRDLPRHPLFGSAVRRSASKGAARCTASGTRKPVLN